MTSFKMEPGPVHLFRIPTGGDIYDGITDFARANQIEAAWLSYLGAVRRASLRYFDQEAKEYRYFTVERHLEVLSGVGNISLLDGAPFLHTHAAFGDEEGKAFGGHIDVGCEVWAVEVSMQELIGEAPERKPDDCTGLALWDSLSPES